MPRPLFPPALIAAGALASCIIHIDGGDWDGHRDGVHHVSHGDGPVRRGSGELATEERDLDGFDAVQVTGIFDVEVRVGAEHRVVLRGDDNLLEYVTTEVRGGALELGMERGRYELDEPLRAEVHLPELRALATTGSGDARVHGVDRAELALSITGSGDVEVAGRVESVTLNCSGSGEADLTGLEARRATVTISGSSDVELSVEERLEVSISGSGTVRYGGKPAVSISISGSGDVGPR